MVVTTAVEDSLDEEEYVAENVCSGDWLIPNNRPSEVEAEKSKAVFLSAVRDTRQMLSTYGMDSPPGTIGTPFFSYRDGDTLFFEHYIDD